MGVYPAGRSWWLTLPMRRVPEPLGDRSGTTSVVEAVAAAVAPAAALIEPGVWAQQTYLDDHSTLIVFADGPYDSAEYAAADSASDPAAASVLVADASVVSP